MKQLEKILVMLVVTGLVMQRLQIREGALIAVLAGGALLLFYAAGSFFLLHNISFRKTAAAEKRTPATIIASVMAGLVFAYTVLAVVGKMLIWPGGQPMIETAAMLLVILLIAVFTLVRKKEPVFSRRLLVRSVCFLVASVIAWFL